MKSGFVSIIGRPNVGKSTLLNAIIGEKIAIATEKPQTTRNRIRGIYTDDQAQMIFLDTPGIHTPRNKLGEYMTETALSTMGDGDVILFLVDSDPSKGPGDARILEQLEKTDRPKLLIINKTDILDPEEYRRIFEAYESKGIFHQVMGISARKGIGIDHLIATIKELLPEGPAYYPSDMVTDHPERFLAGEIIREKLLLYLKEEVPHGVAVEIESYEEEEDLTRIHALIYCEKKSHKAIIIGKDGRKLKGVGKSARQEIERMTGTKVHLELWVKVKDKWRDSESLLRDLGYRE